MKGNTQAVQSKTDTLVAKVYQSGQKIEATTAEARIFPECHS